MRLTTQQQHTIQRVTHQFLGSGARIFVFGSRLDEQAKGGDVDLYITSDDNCPMLQQAKLKHALESALQLPVDIVFYQHHTQASAFQNIARLTSQPLEVLP